eukprot:1535983-Pleurochrysis_carterae.AAC.2
MSRTHPSDTVGFSGEAARELGNELLILSVGLEERQAVLRMKCAYGMRFSDDGAFQRSWRFAQAA